MKKALVILTALLILASTIIIVHSEDLPSDIYLEAVNGKLECNRAEELEFILKGRNVADLYTVQAEFNYDPIRLELDAESIANLAWTDSETAYSAIELNAVEGKLKVIFSKTGRFQGENGNLDIMKLKFKTKVIGSTRIDINNVKLVNSIEQYINISPVQGVDINVLPNPLNVNITGTAGNEGWYVSNVDIAVEDIDAKEIKYTLDGTELSYTAPFTIESPGIHNLKVVTDDGYGYKKEKEVEIKIDNVKPVITAEPAQSDWVNSDITVQAQYSDEGGSVLKSRWFKWSNDESIPAEWNPYEDASLIQQNEGVWYLHAKSEDNAGNITVSKFGPYRIDKIAPTASVDRETRETWENTDMVILPSFEDKGGSLIKTAEYSWSFEQNTPGDWQTYSTGNIVQSQDGTWYLHLRVEDNAGNSTTNHYGPYKVDKTAPVAKADPDIADWTNKDVSIAPEYADEGGSGLKDAAYAWSSSADTPDEWIAYEGGGLSYTEQGVWYLHMKAGDNAGNVTIYKYGPYKIDKTIPEVSVDIESRETWENIDMTVIPTYSDEGGSQLKSAMYAWSKEQTMPESWESCSSESITQTQDGEWYLYLKAEDNAGNIKIRTYGPYKVDKTAPVALAEPSSKDWINTDISVMPEYKDEGGSQVSSMHYVWSSSADTPESWEEYASGNLVQGQEGIWYLHMKVGDNAGNVTVSKYGPYKIDKTMPETSVDVTERAWENTDVTIVPNYTDEGGSQIKTMEYSWSTSQEDPASWSGYNSGNLTQNQDGFWYLYLRVEDNAGNITISKYGPYGVDKTQPVISHDFEDDYIYLDDLELDYTVEDEMSGVAETSITINGEVHEQGDTVQLVWPGEYDIEITATDIAGNSITIVHEINVIVHAEINVDPDTVNLKKINIDDDNVGESITEENDIEEGTTEEGTTEEGTTEEGTTEEGTTEEGTTEEGTTEEGTTEEDTTEESITEENTADEGTSEENIPEENTSEESTTLKINAVVINAEARNTEKSDAAEKNKEGKKENGNGDSSKDEEDNENDKGNSGKDEEDSEDSNGDTGNNGGGMITIYIEFPEGADVSDIIPETLMLNGEFAPISDPKYGYVKEPIKDYDGDGKLEYMIKFRKADISQELLNSDGNITISGSTDTYEFEGFASVRILK